MVENLDNSAPVQAPHGPAETQAKQLSLGEGALAGAAFGGLFGLVSSFFMRQRGLVRSAVWTGLGAFTGYSISNMTWVNPARTEMHGPLPQPQPQMPAVEAPMPEQPAPTEHVQRLTAERDAAVDVSAMIG